VALIKSGDKMKKRTMDAKKKIRKKKIFREKACKFCADRQYNIDYKDVARLQRYVTEKGKIIPRRISGNCGRCQKKLALAVKRARQMALLAAAVK